MPFKPPPNNKSIASLRESLADSRIQKDNNALYQTLFGLITLAEDFQQGINDSFKAADDLPSNQISGNIPYQQGGVLTGYFLPLPIGVLNASTVDINSSYYTTWWRMGNIVFVSGKLNFNPDAGDPITPVLTQIEMAPPFGSLFAHTEQANGILSCKPFGSATPGQVGFIWANPGNLNVVLEFSLESIENMDLRYMYSYEYIPLNS